MIINKDRAPKLVAERKPNPKMFVEKLPMLEETNRVNKVGFSRKATKRRYTQRTLDEI